MMKPGPDSTPVNSVLPVPAFLAAALALIVIWGTAYTMVSVGVDYIPPIWLVSLRCVLGAFLVTVFCYARGYRLPKLTDKRWAVYFGLGITGMVAPFWLLSIGQISVDSGIAAIIVGAMPILTIVLAHFFAHEPLTWRKFTGFVIGFFGIVILFLPEDFSLALISDWKAQALILGAAFFYAVTTVAAKRAPDTSAVVGATIMLISAAITSTAMALYSGIPETMPPAIGWWMAVGLGVGSTAIGTILYLWVVEKSGPSAMAKINYFPPLISVLAGVWLLSEEFTYRAIIALVVILVGVALSRPRRRKRTVPPTPLA
ncbi:DMT family transporter [Robiginitomaculum antarcticum]|uniref:DMT family transporter n=1 Tax=Robiginitomaculum antarcticum TaxID=437507 RepID=UPI000A06CCAF|nr:EamA family transporter [Robiginitomaculum antarcticum]